VIEQTLTYFLREKLGGEWVIAGGFVRDKLLGRAPRDIDCFRLSKPLNQAERDTCWLEHDLNQINIIFTKEERKYDGSSVPIRIRFLEYDVHLIESTFADPEEILASFDFNICKFYLDEQFRVKSSSTDRADLFAKNMILQHDRTPASSLRRGYLFEYRLGFKFQPRDVRALVEKLWHTKMYEV
jgi:hypothetical protein